jgi:hypothetical protein
MAYLFHVQENHALSLLLSLMLVAPDGATGGFNTCNRDDGHEPQALHRFNLA